MSPAAPASTHGPERVYTALAPHQLAGVLASGQLPEGAPVHAVTPALRRLLPEADAEELELAALLDAADSSLRLLAGSPPGAAAPARRLVLAGDVPPASVRHREVLDGDPAEALTRAELSPPLGLRAVVSAHVDEAEAEPDVAAAVAALPAADAGQDAAASAVEAARERDLLWYDATELTALAAELGGRGEQQVG